jgi:hypothetical protein
MPSDPRVANALAAVAAQIAVFRSVVAGETDRARQTLAAELGPNQVGAELGEFASGRIDPTKFAMISAGSAPLDAVARSAMQAAAKVLECISQADNDQFVVDVLPGRSVGSAIRSRFRTLGAAFAAGSIIEHVKRRTFDTGRHTLPADGYPFEKWSSTERRLAPPLVVTVYGSDLDPFEIAPFLDGCVQIVLLVNGPCASAPLARLISPSVFVAQADDLSVLEKMSEIESPAVAAIMNGPEALFVHDPRAGAAMFQRVRINRVPATPVRKAIGSRTAWQQREDIALLRSYVELTAPDSPRQGSAVDPTERLTEWLIEQSSLLTAS